MSENKIYRELIKSEINYTLTHVFIHCEDENVMLNGSLDLT